MDQINKKYNDKYIDSEVFIDEGLEIYINGRHAVQVDNIANKKQGIEIAEMLLNSFDFSFFLEFDNIDEVKEFIK